MTPELAERDLAALEARVDGALRAGRADGLTVLGYGEITTVVLAETDAGRFACKRLPPFRDHDAVERYRAVFEAYVARLAERGVAVLPSTLRVRPGPDGPRVWCIQPALDGERLLTRYLRTCGEAEAVARLEAVLDHVDAVVDERMGLDGQLSNWAVTEDGLAYLDVTTPMLRDPEGAELLDLDLFMASLPWALRRPVRRWILAGILDKYYVRRGVALDLLGNLYKERLTPLLPAFIERAAARYGPGPTPGEVARYYASDARSWALLQRLRRLDRLWQRHVRRRVYPFLLPGRIER